MKGDGMRRVAGIALLAMLPVVHACAGGDGGDSPTDPGGDGDPRESMADVTVTISGRSSASDGEVLTYTVRVRNAGPDDATNVVVETTFPEDAAFQSASDGGTRSGGSVTWPAVASLANGAVATMTLRLTAQGEGELVVVATATSDTPDPDPSNNDGSAEDARIATSVAVRADVQVTLSGATVTIPGREDAYTITVANRGPSTAEGVVVIDSLPPGMDVVSVSDGGSAAGREVRWPARSLADGEEVTLTYSATPPLVGPFRNRALSTAETDDPAPGNNGGTSGAGVLQSIVGFEPLYTVTGGPGSFGWEAESLGDIDGDGAGDFALSALTEGGGAGAAHVYSGATGSELFVFRGSNGENLGIDMDAGEDLDGDGVSELLLGGNALAGARGRVRIYSLLSGTEIAVLDGENSGDRFGENAGFAGDVDGDGTVDVVVGAPGFGGGRGRVYLYSGADFSLLYTIDGSQGGAGFGQAARGIGDVDGDGRSDVAVGAPNWGGAGRMFVYSGADGSEIYQIPPDAGASTFTQFWISSPGDVDGDGINDILTADITHNGAGSQAGRVYVFSGATGAEIYHIDGENPGDQLAIAHPAGDVDGDGTGDFVAAAWLSDEGASNAGKSYVFSGATGQAIRSFTSTTGNAQSGFDVFAVDDLNGDGVKDYLITGNVQTNGGDGPTYVVAGIRP